MLKWFFKLEAKQVIWFIFLLGVGVYFSAFFNGFVGDDNSQVLENPLAHSIANIPNHFKGSTFAIGNVINGIYYRPLMTSFFSVVYSIFGPNAFWFHFFQVNLHIINSILVFLFLKRFYKVWLAGILATIFLVHPINAETVLYISAAQDVLFFLFGIWALLVVKGKGVEDYVRPVIFASILLFLSLLSKETGIGFVLISLLYVWLFLKDKFSLFGLVIGGVSFFYILLRVSVIGLGGDKEKVIPIMNLSFWERLVNIPKILYTYLETLVFPSKLVTGQIWVVSKIDWINFWMPLIVSLIFVGVLFWIGLFLSKKSKNDLKIFLFFLTWFLVGFGLHSQIIPLDQTVAERYFYLPFVGVLGIVGVVIKNLQVNFSRFYLVGLFFVIFVVLGFVIRTNFRILDWRDGLTLAKRDIAQSFEGNLYLENNLGYELSKSGDFEGAIKHYSSCAELASGWWGCWNNLGSAQLRYAKQTDKKEYIDLANESFGKAVELAGSYGVPSENKAVLLYQFKDLKVAEEFLKKQTVKFPQNPKLWFYLGLVEKDLGETEKAKEALYRASRLDSKNQNYQKFYNLLLEGKPFTINKI